MKKQSKRITKQELDKTFELFLAAVHFLKSGFMKGKQIKGISIKH